LPFAPSGKASFVAVAVVVTEVFRGSRCRCEDVVTFTEVVFVAEVVLVAQIIIVAQIVLEAQIVLVA
jgi:hypothetical protein